MSIVRLLEISCRFCWPRGRCCNRKRSSPWLPLVLHHLPGLVPSSTREWGAVLAHLGVLIMLVGITGSSSMYMFCVGEPVIQLSSATMSWTMTDLVPLWFRTYTSYYIGDFEGQPGAGTDQRRPLAGSKPAFTQVGIFSTRRKTSSEFRRKTPQPNPPAALPRWLIWMGS